MSTVDDVLNVMTHNGQPATAEHNETRSTGPRLWAEIKQIITTAIANQPRSLQKKIGPSELGTDCLHCLAARLAGWEQREEASWLPYEGTAVHAQLERLFNNLDWNANEEERGRWETEYPVSSGYIGGLTGGYTIGGHIDLWDKRAQATVDWKIVGSTTLRDVKANGPSQDYRVQASLYGLGLQNEGETVRISCIFFLPRNGLTLNEAYPWEAAFDPEPGLWALRRANLLATILDLIEAEAGVETRDQWISALPRTTSGHCFNCGKYADAAAANPLTTAFATPPADLPEKYQTLAALLESTYQPVTPTTK